MKKVGKVYKYMYMLYVFQKLLKHIVHIYILSDISIKM